MTTPPAAGDLIPIPRDDILDLIALMRAMAYPNRSSRADRLEKLLSAAPAQPTAVPNAANMGEATRRSQSFACNQPGELDAYVVKARAVGAKITVAKFDFWHDEFIGESAVKFTPEQLLAFGRLLMEESK